MAKIVLLNSGGLDSAIVAKYARDKLGHELHSLHFDTKQVNREQQMAAAATTASKYCNSHKVVTIDFGQTSNYWEVTGQAGSNVEMYDSLTASQNYDYKMTRQFTDFHVFPNMSMVFLSLGVSYAKTIGATHVVTGHRLQIGEQFLLQYDSMADMNLHRLQRPQIIAPFSAATSYRDAAIMLVGAPLTIAKANALRTEFSYTYSCRWPTPCGVCEKCTGRAEIGL